MYYQQRYCKTITINPNHKLTTSLTLDQCCSSSEPNSPSWIWCSFSLRTLQSPHSEPFSTQKQIFFISHWHNGSKWWICNYCGATTPTNIAAPVWLIKTVFVTAVGGFAARKAMFQRVAGPHGMVPNPHLSCADCSWQPSKENVIRGSSKAVDPSASKRLMPEHELRVNSKYFFTRDNEDETTATTEQESTGGPRRRRKAAGQGSVQTLRVHSNTRKIASFFPPLIAFSYMIVWEWTFGGRETWLLLWFWLTVRFKL